MKKAPIIRLIIIIIIAGCSHEHQIQPHEHETPHHEHAHEHINVPAKLVRISEPLAYIPDVAPNDNVGSICSAKVNIVFSSTPMNTVINASIAAFDKEEKV